MLALRPDRPGPHVSLGTALQRAGRRSEAREHYLKALEIQPNFGPAHMHLGSLHEELGAMDEAEAAFRTALKLQPEFTPPHARLATLLRHKLPDDDLAALEARLADDKLADGPRRDCSSAWPTRWMGGASTLAPPTACNRPTPSRSSRRAAATFITPRNTSGSSTA